MDLKQQDKFCDDLLNYLKNNSYSMIKGFSEYWGKDFSTIFNLILKNTFFHVFMINEKNDILNTSASKSLSEIKMDNPRNKEGVKIIRSFSLGNKDMNIPDDFLRFLEINIIKSNNPGFYLPWKKENHIFIQGNGFLNTLFHEIQHAFSNDKLALKKNKFSLFSSDELICSNGIFLDKESEDSKMIMEVFNDYFTFESMNNLKDCDLGAWKYGIIFKTLYSEFFPYICVFLDSFEELMKYASYHNLPNLIYEVLGFENFQKFVGLFKKGNLPINKSTMKTCEEIIEEMRKHARNYQVNYYETVKDYLETLEQNGEKVRILDNSMEKLKMEEKAIRFCQSDLY